MIFVVRAPESVESGIFIDGRKASSNYLNCRIQRMDLLELLLCNHIRSSSDSTVPSQADELRADSITSATPMFTAVCTSSTIPE